VSRLRIISPSEYRAEKWRNGRGETLVLHTEFLPHSTDFAYRVSIAAVDTDGPFSEFSGYDRTLVLLGGNGVTLQHDGKQSDELMSRFSVARFSGDSKTVATLREGPIQDFNLMSHRDSCTTQLDLAGQSAKPDLSIRSSVLLAYAVDHSIKIRMPSQEAIIIEPNHLLHYQGPAHGTWRFQQGLAIVVQVFKNITGEK
jgi:environmental stress-induced protein Ves